MLLNNKYLFAENVYFYITSHGCSSHINK